MEPESSAQVCERAAVLAAEAHQEVPKRGDANGDPGCLPETFELPLSNSNRPCLVDTEDVERYNLTNWAEDVERYNLTNWAWRVGTDGYVRRDSWANGKRLVVRLHRLIAGAKPGQFVDHERGDKLDNRRSKLRVTDATGNARNVRKPGRLKGVHWHRKGKCWECAIGAGPKRDNGKARKLYLGLYRDPIDAAQTYDRASLYYFGEFASLNFPELIDVYLAQLTWDGIHSTPVQVKADEVEAA